MFAKRSLILIAAFSLLALPALGQGAPRVALETNHGVITLELDSAAAPKSVANFLEYVESGHYDGTVFHRVIAQFMIQGGGFDGDLVKKPTLAPIENESKNGLSNARGTIAMARTSNPHSATSQFYINNFDNPNLDYNPSAGGWGYAVFGKVVEGMDVVDKISALETRPQGGHANVPIEPVIIVKASKVGG